MNKLNKFLSLVLLLIITWISNTNANEIKIKAAIENTSPIITIIENKETEKEEIKTEIVTLKNEDIFIYFSTFFKDIPKSYKHIGLKYKFIKEKSEIETALKKLVYLNKLDNREINLNLNKEMNAYVFFTLAKEILELDIIIDPAYLTNRNVVLNDLNIITNTFNNKKRYEHSKSTNNILWDKKDIFSEVYNTLINEHYDYQTLEKNDIVYGAIEWLAKWTHDIHTVYFPPVESKNFEDSLSWEYEWIWSYVEMTSPWQVKITSPIPWGPAERYGLKWWDIITKVDWKIVTRDNSLVEVVSWIKWPAWTYVKLSVLRNWEEFEIDVKREKIIVKNLEVKAVNSNIYNIQIRTFWVWVASEFREALTKIKSDSRVNKIIIDLRNNWGGYLNEATDMLSMLINEWEKTATIRYNWVNNHYFSSWEWVLDINKYKVIILQNSWTASASEIMIWTLKDYFPNIVTIWENTYWKWSVQALKEFQDWSSLKYTVARWYTWKTMTWIDWIWFKPDLELELDIEKYKNDLSDNQLQKAINY